MFCFSNFPGCLLMHWSARCIQLVLSAYMVHFHNCEKDLEKNKEKPKEKKKKDKGISFHS